MNVVLDASAVLAIMFGETGAECVTKFARGSMISSVNVTEVLEKFARAFGSANEVLPALAELEIGVVSFDVEQARIAADLKPRVGSNDSLADRSCLALALYRQATVLTGDRAWADLDLGLDIRMIR